MAYLKVASFTDAWIETKESKATRQIYKSHLLQMRGLKPPCDVIIYYYICRIFYRCVD